MVIMEMYALLTFAMSLHHHIALFLLLGLSESLWAAPPVYQVTALDPTWTRNANGSYSITTPVEDYDMEVWERPLEDGKWSTSGNTITTTGKYYGYGDIKEASYGVDSTNLYVRITAASDELGEIGKPADPVGLKARQYFYFGVGLTSTKRFFLNIDDGSSVSEGSTFGQIGKVYRDNDGDAIGAGISVTYDDNNAEQNGNGFETEVAPSALLARRNGFSIEMMIALSALGLTSGEFSQVNFAYAGLAVSNPSSNTDVFANDQFRFAAGVGVEYDTVSVMPSVVPEPGSTLCLVVGTATLLLRRRRAQ